MQVTIITPIAPWHEGVFVRCADSVHKQTIPCRHLHMVDTEQRGPGYIRNLLLKQVKTKFVVFLDADDYLEPDFVYECLKASTPDRYVYTNWYQGTEEKETPDGAFWDTAWHLVTCLIHTSMITLAGGFNEDLQAMEDTELFLKFDEYAYCGTKVQKPLVHYTNDGKRSSTARSNGLFSKIRAEFSRRYRVGCCGGKVNTNNLVPIGKRLPGDILVMPLWEGNRNVVGQITGRRYGRAAKTRKVWMDRKDVVIRPDLYYVLPEPTTVIEPKKVVRQRVTKPLTFADMLQAAGVLEIPAEAPLPVVATDINPNHAKLNSIAQRIYNAQRNIKPSIDSNSKAVKPITRKAKSVRKRSTSRGNAPGREQLAVGNG